MRSNIEYCRSEKIIQSSFRYKKGKFEICNERQYEDSYTLKELYESKDMDGGRYRLRYEIGWSYINLGVTKKSKDIFWSTVMQRYF